MTRLTDAVEQVEYDMDKYPGSDAGSLLNRRLVLRKALEAWGRDQYGEGHRDGMRDVRDTIRLAQERIPEDPQRYAFTVQRVGKLTPHQARQQAEAECESLRGEVQRLRGQLEAPGGR